MRLVVRKMYGKPININSFQFQCGAIGSKDNEVKKVYQIRFNSSVVRLVVIIVISKPISYHCFNSSVVRLVVTDPILRRSENIVSIPVWCDW